MTEEVKMFMKNIGLEINREKSATNDSCCENTATLLEVIGVYKYLGIIEDSRGIPTRKSFEEVQTKLIARVETFPLEIECKKFISSYQST
ncbi:hypothetical protein CWI39_0620p0040, partial [Hamiltosporidium magnivora]